MNAEMSSLYLGYLLIKFHNLSFTAKHEMLCAAGEDPSFTELFLSARHFTGNFGLEKLLINKSTNIQRSEEDEDGGRNLS